MRDSLLFLCSKIDARNMAKTFVIHDESLNSKGFWMLTSGCDLSQFEKNPIMLWNHNYAWGDDRENNLPIGHWDNVRIKGKQILADAVFDSDEFAQKIAQKVESGSLRMASVGAKAIEMTNDKSMIKPGQRYETVTKWVLKEVSIVNIGANDNALAMSDVVLYDNESKLINLSDEGSSPLKLLDNQPKNSDKMDEVKKLLNLSDDASEKDVLAKVKPLLDLAQKLSDVTTERDGFKVRIEAIELAEKEANSKEAKDLIAVALKDGRLTEDKEGSVEKFWLSSFEGNHEGSKKMLAALPKRKNVIETLSDGEGGYVPGKFFAAKQSEIEKNNSK